MLRLPRKIGNFQKFKEFQERCREFQERYGKFQEKLTNSKKAVANSKKGLTKSEKDTKNTKIFLPNTKNKQNFKRSNRVSAIVVIQFLINRNCFLFVFI